MTAARRWTSIGDADYFYGSVTEDGSSISYFPGALEIRDGYVYTTAVYDIDHRKDERPARDALCARESEDRRAGNSGLKRSNFKKAARRPPFSLSFRAK